MPDHLVQTVQIAQIAHLVQIVDSSFASAAARSGTHLVCHPGCTQCCHGVFVISPVDAVRLRSGLALADREDPERSARIRSRLAEARAHLAPFFPGDPETGILGPDPDAVELFEEWANADPCPVLDPTTGTCDLYAHRPVLCRTFGPPIRIDHTDPDAGFALCELCFTEASEAEIAIAEMDSTFRPLEQSLDDLHLKAHPDDGQTMVAFAFPPRQVSCRPMDL